ncbi:TIGR04255 family protein [Stenotrophomonas panacihumi]|nr:TIGR04255 family protein [Stenotrophomonas panacihumi]
MAQVTADVLFGYQSPNVDAYKLGFLKSIVCELRFPTLLELGNRVPPHAFVKALRKSYPTLELGNEVSFAPGVQGSTSHFHVLRSLNTAWAIALRPNALQVEGTKYTTYADLRARVEEVVAAASEMVDADSWTRVGLRFVNLISHPEDPINGAWLNSAIVGPLHSAGVQGLTDFGGRISAMNEDGRGFNFQHQLQLRQVEDRLKPEYVIDIDAYAQGIALGDTLKCLDSLHELAFNIFDWSLGEDARSYLRGG